MTYIHDKKIKIVNKWKITHILNTLNIDTFIFNFLKKI